MSKEEEYIKHNAKKSQKLNNKYNIKGAIDKKYTFSLRFKPLINEFITHKQNEPSSNITATIIKTIKISQTTKYIGETINNSPNGFGIYISDSYTYKGMWKNSLKSGWGRVIIKEDEEYQAFFKDDKIEGFCYHLTNNKSINITGEFINAKYNDVLIIEDMISNKKYEGYVIDEEKKVSIGKISEITKNKKTSYYGEITKYRKAKGYGFLIKENSFAYLGCFKNKKMVGHSEMYYAEGVTFVNIEKGIKKGIGFLFRKDGKISYGQYEQDWKHGPFFIFNNNDKEIKKETSKMDFYLYGFKVKSIDGFDNSVNYVKYYYPEFEEICCIPFQAIFEHYRKVIEEEKKYYEQLYINKETKKNDKNK